MTIIDTVKAQFSPAPVEVELDHGVGEIHSVHAQDADIEGLEKPAYAVDVVERGVSNVEAAQAVWGKYGKWYIAAGIAMMMVLYELDNSTVYVYNGYGTSTFDKVSVLSTLSTASSILFAVVKPLIAKISNVIGRGETYLITISCYVLSYILLASAKNINTYAAGSIIYSIGQSGTNIMNDIIISDISSARWRGLALGISFFPFLIIPWISAYIVESCVTGIGWRWGIGMFAILMPFGASAIITALLYYQHKAKKAGITVKQRITIYEFCSQVDLGGSILLSGGFAMILLPFTLAATTPARWSTPYVDVLIALGCVFIIALPFYEKFVAKHPIVPFRYFKTLSITMSCLLIATDSLGFEVTHTYLYTWASIARGYDARMATFYIYTNGVTQCLFGIMAGLIMLKTRKYKWMLMSAVCIRLIGYGIMMRLRGANNSDAELFIVQLIQGIGSGIIQIAVIVSAQVVVPHAEMAQVTALVLCCSFLGSSIGTSIAGGIYTNTLKDALYDALGSTATQSLVDTVYSSITGVIPAWGTVQRTAIDEAVSLMRKLEGFEEPHR
ncbi:MAG: hypothetical protein M1818_007584 [Claussenomyces sp. TS43310]|nr:MAG: hypothetical protein M1818_007584 [Claussenomyces sp. TS43310]